MQTAVELEREQLLFQWRGRLKRNPDWISKELRQVERIVAASHGDVDAQRSLGSYLRQFHDKLGYKAKGSLSDGGLCGGAIFRTQSFIDTTDRRGSKKFQSVHIEHTFPINELRREIVKQSFQSHAQALAWLLKHSVTTAFHEDEKQHLIGHASKSSALDPQSTTYNRPFARYEKLHRSAKIVWNVFDRAEVEPESFTFCDHYELILRLLDEAGAARQMLASLQMYS